MVGMQTYEEEGIQEKIDEFNSRKGNDKKGYVSFDPDMVDIAEYNMNCNILESIRETGKDAESSLRDAEEAVQYAKEALDNLIIMLLKKQSGGTNDRT
jgi:arginase family enzyme